MSLRPMLWCTRENLSPRLRLWGTEEGNMSLRPELRCIREGTLSPAQC